MVEEFKKKTIYLFRRKHWKILTFTVEKEVPRIDKNGGEITKLISYILQFIDSTRFIASSLSNLENNLWKEFKELNVNLYMVIRNKKLVELNISNVTVFLNTQILRWFSKICLCCNFPYQQKFDEKLKERFFNTCKFSNHDNNKFALL